MPGLALDENFVNGLVWIIQNLYILIFISAFLMFIAVYKIFDNERISGWLALIPIYNTMKLYEIADLPKWFGILLWIPVINFVYIFIFPLLSIKLAKKYQKNVLHGILMSIFPFIFYPLLVYKIPNLNSLFKKTQTREAIIVGTEPEIIDISNNDPVEEISYVEDVNIDYQAQDINPYDEPIEEEIEITVNKTPMDLLYEMPDLSMGNKAVSIKQNQETKMKVEDLLKPNNSEEK